jgi:hypothetical protein
MMSENLDLFGFGSLLATAENVTDVSVQPQGIEQTQTLLSQMLHDAHNYKSHEDYKALLDFVVRMRELSPFNAMLLHIQNPHLKVAFTLKQWQSKYQRTIKPNARPLIILRPFGPIALVYDISDTVGKTVPAHLVETFPTFGSMEKNVFSQHIKCLKKKYIECIFTELAESSAGSIRNAQPVIFNGKSMPAYLVTINSQHKTITQFVTLLHELAHLALGHLGKNTLVGIPGRTNLSLGLREVEAEFVAYVVAKRHQIEPESHRYLSGYVGDIEPDDIDIYQIMRSIAVAESFLKC